MTTGGDLTYHVPYSESPNDEFQTPCGIWYSTLRAITFDSWLLWRHALPEDELLWPQLSQSVFETIEALAQRIHHLHQAFPDYRRLADTPFHVSTWWDPSDPHGDWIYGDRVQLKITGYTAREIEQEAQPRLKGQLRILPLSKHWVEISLLRGPSSRLSEADENL
jgi:hypothetical protein